MKITSGIKISLLQLRYIINRASIFRNLQRVWLDEKVENDTSEHEYMSKIMAIFIDMLEIVNMDYIHQWFILAMS